MKKVLLGIVGQYRTFEKTYLNILNNIIDYNKNEYQFEIIINTDYSNTNIIDYFNKPKENYHYDNISLQQKFNNCYGKYLKHIINYIVNAEDIKNGAFEIFKKRIVQICKYVENNKLNYDMFIFIRFDIQFTNVINLNDYNKNQFTFICNDIINKNKRIDHYRDWDFCWISNDLKFFNYFCCCKFDNFINEPKIEELIDFSTKINFMSKYIEDIKISKNLYEHWVKNFWILFYNMYINDCNIYFEENVFAYIVR
jgi:hypothetical protein